jgi:Uma2 family endonuclease
VVTQDDTPVATLFEAKQRRLLTEPLYSSWAGPGKGIPFLALSNVGLFYSCREPPLVPDALLALGGGVGEDLHVKENHSYFVWLQGKAPDVVIEIISDRRGAEADIKLRVYARIGVPFYVIFDPQNLLEGGTLRAFGGKRDRFEPIEPRWLPELGLGLTLWEGLFARHRQTWLRWCDQNGRVIPTGSERAVEANEKLLRLEARLRALGVEPEV